MRFPLKFALTAVLAKGIVAELAHLPQTQATSNDLDLKYHPEYKGDFKTQPQEPVAFDGIAPSYDQHAQYAHDQYPAVSVV